MGSSGDTGGRRQHARGYRSVPSAAGEILTLALALALGPAYCLAEVQAAFVACGGAAAAGRSASSRLVPKGTSASSTSTTRDSWQSRQRKPGGVQH